MILETDKFIEGNENIECISLTNNVGMHMLLCTMGASIFSWSMKNRSGAYDEITIHPADRNYFLHNTQYFGKSIGPHAGRIDKGHMTIDGKDYYLEKNWNGISSLHGGSNGLSEKNCSYNIQMGEDYVDVLFRTKLENKENGFPGDSDVYVTYRIYDKERKVTIFYHAISSENTVMSLTNHTYFNLNGNVDGTILKHNLIINASQYGYCNDELISENILDVNETMDFRKGKEIGKDINDEYLQKHTSFGYDHPFIFTRDRDVKKPVVVLENSLHTRKMNIITDYPCIVVYTCNYPCDAVLYNGKHNQKYDAICLESSFLPNGINMENKEGFLEKGKLYSHFITYEFEEL